MYCSRCAQPQVDNAAYCHACGSKLQYQTSYQQIKEEVIVPVGRFTDAVLIFLGMNVIWFIFIWIGLDSVHICTQYDAHHVCIDGVTRHPYFVTYSIAGMLVSCLFGVLGYYIDNHSSNTFIFWMTLWILEIFLLVGIYGSGTGIH